MLSIPKTERNQSSVSQFVQLCDQVRDDSGASMRIVHLVHETDAKGFNPKSVPDKEIIVPKVQHPERKVKPADLYNNGITEDVYQMMSKPRGYALIMNNEVFDYELELKTRTGSEVDVMSLKDVLEQCDFKVEIHRNKHSGDMKRILKNFASKAEHAHVDATMVVIMSHGNSEKGRDFVYSCDHREIDREWILTQFNNANAPALQNKPKVFLFQCCRGDEPDVGVVPKEMAFAGRIETDGKSDDVPQMRKMPTFSHMLIANATVPGYASFRSPKEGTWFIQTLCQEIADHACDRHFVKMLKKLLNPRSFLVINELRSDPAIFVDSRRDYSCDQRRPSSAGMSRNFESRDDNRNTARLSRDRNRHASSPSRRATEWIPLIRAKIYNNGEPDAYEMMSNPRGLVLIINNKNFTVSPDSPSSRVGSEFDAESIKQLFQELYFTVEHYSDLEYDKMKSTIRDFVAREEHKTANACFVFIMSHGAGARGEDSFYTSDSKVLPISWIEDQFNNENAPNLHGKPKILVLHCCRGGAHDYGVRTAHHQLRDISPNLQHDGSALRNTLPASRLPAVTDMLVAYSTIPGKVSHRDTDYGTWYIQTLCRTIRKHAHELKLRDILDRIEFMSGAQCNISGDSSGFINVGCPKVFCAVA
ncbi:unnamed protein product [Notodromas monacha]|uniref:Uncharacterized protein n=1 Tax=Notodromas monacha TaxID=399045 RepID=A0A7R9BIL3_9CRUS|nr:unnamed protein product [Notodromas monacha]CAG0915895.1 unnamed protein product [Notodromas monacha]